MCVTAIFILVRNRTAYFLPLRRSLSDIGSSLDSKVFLIQHNSTVAPRPESVAGTPSCCEFSTG
jgi:hypothetical protein